MNQKEVFYDVVHSLCETYKLSLERPYCNSYFVLRTADGREVANMNPDGFNLLANLETLVLQLGPELL